MLNEIEKNTNHWLKAIANRLAEDTMAGKPGHEIVREAVSAIEAARRKSVKAKEASRLYR